MSRFSLRSIILGALLGGALWTLPVPHAAAQTAPDPPLQISWEVKNRFRLFREERDFQLHAETLPGRSTTVLLEPPP